MHKKNRSWFKIMQGCKINLNRIIFITELKKYITVESNKKKKTQDRKKYISFSVNKIQINNSNIHLIVI